MRNSRIGQEDRAAEQNRENLMRIVRDNQNTDFGKRHGFREIGDIEEYRKRVAVSEYGDYREGIRAMRRGERNVLTAYEVAGYCSSSGTEGEIKYIPLTYEALSRYSDWPERYKKRVYREAGHGKRLFVNTFRTVPGDRETRDMLLSELYYRWMTEQGLFSAEEYVGGEEGLFDDRSEDVLYAKVWLGFAEEELVLIEGIYLYDILHFFGYMESHWAEIIADMERGSIPPDIALSPRLRRRLLSVRPDARRLERVRAECSAGFSCIAERLWSGLRLVCGIGSRTYSAEEEALKSYTGEIGRYYFCYCASECLMGEATGENRLGYRLIGDCGFYEFLPLHGENGETLLPHQLKKDELYEIVVTNFSGLYRYRIGDVLRVTGFDGGMPVMEFVFRRNVAFNLVGEKMQICHLEDAVAALKERIPVQGFCVGASLQRIPAAYYALVALADDEVKRAAGDRERLEEEFDSALGDRNVDYLDLRRLGLLGRARVVPVSTARFAALTGKHLPVQRHNKPPHVLPLEAAEKLYAEAAESYERE